MAGELDLTTEELVEIGAASFERLARASLDR